MTISGGHHKALSLTDPAWLRRIEEDMLALKHCYTTLTLGTSPYQQHMTKELEKERKARWDRSDQQDRELRLLRDKQDRELRLLRDGLRSKQEKEIEILKDLRRKEEQELERLRESVTGFMETLTRDLEKMRKMQEEELRLMQEEEIELGRKPQPYEQLGARLLPGNNETETELGLQRLARIEKDRLESMGAKEWLKQLKRESLAGKWPSTKIKCDWCGALPGEICRTRVVGGIPREEDRRPKKPHQKRVKALESWRSVPDQRRQG